MQPTKAQAAAYQQAFEHFNQALFDGRLPFAYLNFSRHAGAYGFFSPNRWTDASRTKSTPLHEISLNPDQLLRKPIEFYATLVHEMAHHWQHCFGHPSRSGYHNREWAGMMETIGLIPSATGQPGGAKTGQRMTHYIAPGGPYEKAFQALPKHAMLPYVSGPTRKNKAPTAPRKKKHKYQCPGTCRTELWAQTEELEVRCVRCSELFIAAED